jgi:O-antigen ligase
MKIRPYITSLASTDQVTLMQSIIIGLLILTFPYSISNSTVGVLSLLSFSIMLYQKSFDIKKFYKEPIIVALFIFIFFTYASSLWSSIPIFDHSSDFQTGINRFKYYFLLLPSIYFSNFSRQTIKNLLWLIVLAPIPLVIIYYLNSVGLTHYYPQDFGGTATLIGHYLKENIFILFASILLYVHFLFSIKEKKLLHAIIYFILFLIFSTTLFIDTNMSTRLINLAFLSILFVGLFYIFKFKYIFIPSLFIAVLSISFLLTNNKIQTGIQTFEQAIYKHEYTGSWGHRTAYALVGIDIFLEHPLFGTGINDIPSKIREYKKMHPNYFAGEDLIRLHNDHLLILDQVGIVGYLMFIYIIYLLIKVKLSNKKIEVFKNLFIISFMFIMLGEHYLTDKYSTNLFAIVIALVLLHKRLDEEENILSIKKS